MSRDLEPAPIEATAAAIAARSDEPTALDQAIGDGDHGTSTKRGVDAIAVDDRSALIAAVRRTAHETREATCDKVATRGRASFPGERSRGHSDPGAISNQLPIHAVCDVLEAQA